MRNRLHERKIFDRNNRINKEKITHHQTKLNLVNPVKKARLSLNLQNEI